ncbi:MAG: hypothetical protein E6G95_11030 [Alphaproteobacteria bacterium]|nr:MAG: hypothetical protein E6G95_11030 [Alphaproteobacteria bacterium]
MGCLPGGAGLRELLRRPPGRLQEPDLRHAGPARRCGAFRDRAGLSPVLRLAGGRASGPAEGRRAPGRNDGRHRRCDPAADRLFPYPGAKGPHRCAVPCAAEELAAAGGHRAVSRPAAPRRRRRRQGAHRGGQEIHRRFRAFGRMRLGPNRTGPAARTAQRASCRCGGFLMVERVLVVGPKDTISMVDDLASKGFEIVKALHNSPEQKAALPGADYFVGFVQQDAPKLKLIQLLSAGYDRADIAAAIKAKVPMCNNGGANSVAVSEHAVLLMLAVSRRLITQHANVTAGRWHGNAPPTVHEVRNKVLGIIGLGTIGKKVARLAQAFGMIVHYYDIARLKEEQEDALGVRFRLLPEILRTSDIVSMHVPLNDSTRHIIGRQELAVMKKSAIIVNTSRGPVIDEKAMTEALSRGELLDVFDEEPTPPNNPLLKLDNVVLTAHLAGPTWESNITRLRNGFDNVQRVARGEAPLWVVEEMAGKL